MSDKTTTKHTLQYKVVNCTNPRTGDRLNRPLIVNHETYYLPQVIAEGKKNLYLRGQSKELEGNANGLFEMIKELTLKGKSVELANWLRIRPYLTGTVDETRQLTDKNDVRVSVTTLTDLKANANEYLWENIEDTGAIPRIAMIMGVNGVNQWELIEGEGFDVSGKNLTVYSGMGDTVTLSWVAADGSTKSVNLTPSKSNYHTMSFGWNSSLDDVPLNTELTFTFRTQGGVEGGAVYTVSKKVKIVA